MATIEIYFKPATNSGASSTDNTGIASHAYLLYRDDDGQVTGYSRGGPEAARTNNPNGLGIFGNIVTDHGLYVEGTRDYNEANLNTPGFVVYNGTNDQVASIQQKDYNTLDQIQDLGLKYSPFYSNSNSVVGTLLQSDGLSVPQSALNSIYTAPAIENNLLDPNYINEDRTTQDYLKSLSNVPTTYNALSYEEDASGNDIVAIRGNQVALNDSDRQIVVADNSSTDIAGDRNNVILGNSTSGNFSGSGDTIDLQANGGDSIGVFGQNQTVTGDSGNDSVNLGGDGTTATVNGGGYVGLVGNNQTLTLGDAGSSVLTAQGVQNDNVNGSGENITYAANASGNVGGQNDTINLQGNTNDHIGVFGQNQTVTGDSGNDAVNLGGDGTTATVDGGGYVGLVGNNQTLTLGDAGSSVLTAPGVQNDNVNGSSENITYAANASGNIGGQNDTINLQGNARDNIGVFGQNQTVTGDSGNDGVNLGGDGTTATVDGGGYVGLVGSNQTLTLGDAGSTVFTAPNVQGETISGTNANIAFDSNAGGNVAGQGDTIGLRSNGDNHIGVFGQNQTVTGDSGNDGVNLGGDGTTATVNGGGYVGLVGNGQTLTLGDSGSSVATAPNVQNETINGSGETIDLPANVQVTINGSNDTITGNAGQDNITINGAYDSFSGTDDSVNFTGDVRTDTESGASDSYFDNGGYIGGTDDSGGFDSPGGDDGGDDGWDPLVLNLQSGPVQTMDAARSLARFDLHNDGKPVQTGWGTAGEGYLVDAAGGKTTVTDAADLVSCFAGLQALDSNHDDTIDTKDAHWSDLKVWVDGTGTGTFQSGSLRSLTDLGIISIDLDPTPDRHRQNGNLILSNGTFTRRDGSTGQIADIDFHIAPASSQQTQVGATGTAAHAQVAIQAAQLVSAMSTFGTNSAADTATPGIVRPVHIPLAVDPTLQAQRHAA